MGINQATDTLRGRTVPGLGVHNLLREATQPEVDCSQSIDVFRRLARRLKLNKREAQDMINAIGQFATYYKSPPISDRDCFAQIGQCLVVPNKFRFFCKKFNLEVDTPHYGDGESFYHEVNEWQGIIIDWTARQFLNLRTKPYPFIYLAGERGELTSYAKKFAKDPEPSSG